jgi:hypothetical protein
MLEETVAAELLDVTVTGGKGTPSTGTRSCPCKSAGNASNALSKTVLKVTPLGLRPMTHSPLRITFGLKLGAAQPQWKGELT